MTAVALAPVRPGAAPAITWSRLGMLAVIAVALLARIMTGLGTPLWFDETFSAVIASQPSAAAMVDWCRAEIGGPAYYMLLWLWAQLFGTSAVPLRSLSFVASVAGPVLVAWKGHPDRDVRLLWAALLALWLPAIDPATNARCYALALLATTAQAIAFRGLMAAPDRRRALAWTAASCAAVLCHIYAAAIAVVGGLLFLAVHRRRALACWPALAPLIPTAGWFAYQWPVLSHFSHQGAWYALFGPGDLLLAPADFFGSLVLGPVLVIGPLVTLVRGWRGEVGSADRALALSGLLAIGAVLLLATIRSSFTWRYAIPFGPPVLFAVALWAREAERRLAGAPALIVALFASVPAGGIAHVLAKPGDGYRFGYNLAVPSDWLSAHGSRHLAFLWDGPTGSMSDPRRIDEVAGYFLRRHGPARVTVLRAVGAARPPVVIADALRRDRTIDSLIWIADPQVPGTHAMPDRRMLARRGWTCRNSARPPLRMLTCHAPDR